MEFPEPGRRIMACNFPGQPARPVGIHWNVERGRMKDDLACFGLKNQVILRRSSFIL
jgi:hypothetical protein